MLTFPNVMPVVIASPAITDLSPQDMVILPNRNLENFSASILFSSTFQDHLNRTPLFNSPGVDIAVHYCYNNEQTDLKCHSEFDPLVYKAEIRINVSGTLVSVNHSEVEGNDLMAKEYYDPQELNYLQSSGAVYFEPEPPVFQAPQNLIVVPSMA